MGSKDESEESLQELRKVMGDYDVAVYRAAKERRVQELSREGQILAKVIQEHLGVPHFHNALEFADVREGEPYIVNGVSPLAHLATHAAVEAMVEGGNAEMKAAYEKLLSTGGERTSCGSRPRGNFSPVLPRYGQGGRTRRAI